MLNEEGKGKGERVGAYGILGKVNLLTLGNFSKSGHILVLGVPNRSNMSPSCCTSVLPGSNGLPFRISPNIHPTDLCVQVSLCYYNHEVKESLKDNTVHTLSLTKGGG